jgi:hypothetical protein
MCSTYLPPPPISIQHLTVSYFIFSKFEIQNSTLFHLSQIRAKIQTPTYLPSSSSFIHRYKQSPIQFYSSQFLIYFSQNLKFRILPTLFHLSKIRAKNHTPTYLPSSSSSFIDTNNLTICIIYTILFLTVSYLFFSKFEIQISTLFHLSQIRAKNHTPTYLPPLLLLLHRYEQSHYLYNLYTQTISHTIPHSFFFFKI